LIHNFNFSCPPNKGDPVLDQSFISVDDRKVKEIIVSQKLHNHNLAIGSYFCK